MRFIVCLVIVVLTLFSWSVTGDNDIHGHQNDQEGFLGCNNGCTYALDSLQVQSQRSRFTWTLDNYLRGYIGKQDFITAITPLISPGFQTYTVQSPAGTVVVTNRTNFISALVDLTTFPFAGFADHRLVNSIVNPLDSCCNPLRLKLSQYAPNLLLLNFAAPPILGNEVSREFSTWARAIAPCNGLPLWVMDSYYVNSTQLYDSNAINFNLYAPPPPSK